MENMEEQLMQLQMENQTLKDQLQILQLQQKIDKKLWGCGAKNPVAVRAILEDDNTAFEDENALFDAIEAVKNQEPYLFYEKTASLPNFVGIKPAESIELQDDPFIAGFMQYER